MKIIKLSIVTVITCLLTTSAHALKSEDRTIKGNYQVEYTKAPGAVDSIGEMFTEAEVYGRLRSNSFWWDWDTEKASGGSQTRDNNMWGLGGSLVTKTGFFHGLGATAGSYGTIPMHNDNTVGTGTTNYGKSGKDTYHTRADGTEGAIGNFAEAFLEYKNGKTNLKVGRQGINSVMLAMNDTKMIPNTFEAVAIENKDIQDTVVRAGYIMSQKLRNHQSFHSIIAFEKYNENDDAGSHRGLTPSLISGAGEDVNPEMILVTASNKSIPNLKLDGEYVAVSGFFKTAITEANYQIKLDDTWTLTPGIRYLKQMDDGAGAIGGASLSGVFKGNTVYSGVSNGYTNPNSADGSIIMARFIAASGPLELLAGYSKVSDDADIMAMWRGFPTGGYTRSMAQVDWIANTQSWAIKAVYNFGKAGLVPGLIVAADYENMNFDDTKAFVSTFTDRNIFHVDAWQTFKALPNTEFKFRFATIDADSAYTSATAQGTVDYNSYNEYRFEINYLF